MAVPVNRHNKIDNEEAWGLTWPKVQTKLSRHFWCIRHGGQWKGSRGQMVGGGLEFHFKAAMKLVWPDLVFHRWLDMFISAYLQYRTIVVIGPASCVSGETEIVDAISGNGIPISYLASHQIEPVVQTLFGPQKACVPFLKGFAPLFEVKMRSGRKFVATANHLVASPSGFVRVDTLRSGSLLLEYSAYPPRSNSDSDRPVLLASDDRLICKDGDFQSCYPAYCGSDDVPPHFFSEFGQDSPSLRAGVLAHIGGREGPHPGVLAYTPEYNRSCQSICRLSKNAPDSLFCNTETWLLSQFVERNRARDGESFQSPPRFSSRSNPALPLRLPGRDSFYTRQFSCPDYTVQPDVVASVKAKGSGSYYDLSVPNVHHYFANGTVHHNSGKSYCGAICGLLDYFIFPTTTTGIYCSESMERLNSRIWGEVKALHRKAVRTYPDLPGQLIESRYRIVTDITDEFSEGRDFHGGLLCVPAGASQGTAGLASFVGLKNKRVRLYGDELSFLTGAFVDSISNLDKNPDFKCVGMGNPKETTDALGRLAEPAADIGGWDGGIDQQPHSKTWKLRRPDGICVQFVGTDSPNLDGKLGIPLITQEAIDRDVVVYGRDSIQFTMMCQGMMPRGQGVRRVITRQECEKFGARLEPAWANTARTYIASLDAAYGGVGGDRCILCFCEFGEEMPPLIKNGQLNGSALVNQPKPDHQKRHLFALKEMMLVPIKNEKDADTPANQIALFCRQQCELRNIPPANFFYDAGMRTALTQSMSRLWSVHVNTIDFGGKPSERAVSADIDAKCCDYYSKFVTELWYSVRFVIMGGQFRGLDEETMMEFAAREWKMVGANKTEVEPKVEMKKKCGRSPDRADAVSIAVEGARQKGFIIRRLRPAEEPEEDSRWKDQARDMHKKFWRSGQLTETAA